MPKLELLRIFTNGASKGNPGPAAIGFIIENSKGNILERYSRSIGIATNNVAEYTALIAALEHTLTYGRGEIACFCDSKLVVNQLNGIYRVKKGHLRELFLWVKSLERMYKKVRFSYLPETNPKIARVDRMVKKVLEGV